MSEESGVAMDTSVLINLLHVEGLIPLVRFSDLSFTTPREVYDEVQRPRQRAALDRALEQGWLARETMSDPEELAAYAELRARLGRGESACLAIAQQRGWLVASDERRVFLREARRRLGSGRIMNTPGLVLLAVREGMLTVEEADDWKQILEERKFRMSFPSFSSLLGGDEGRER